jgi:3-deoxy-D-manno-octulosonic-acid transferase
MYGLYRIGIRIYGLAIRVMAIFSDKAAKWVEGRKTPITFLPNNQPTLWVHTASLGEFEQGKPFMEAYKKRFPNHRLLLSFFSPSGYEARKNYTTADHIYYLPLDSPQAAKKWLDAIQPDKAVFVKYEFWPCYFRELKARNIPLYVISARFRPSQRFFSGFMRHFWQKVLKQVTHFFVQDELSAQLLQGIGIQQVDIVPDTRFDRVIELAKTPYADPILEAFCSSPCIIAGSSWPADENLLMSCLRHPAFKAWKLVLVPHEIDEVEIRKWMQQWGHLAVRYTDKPGLTELTDARVILIDTVGLLSRIYRYGRIAYVGGGFGKGIHNTLEAAVYGLPVIFGPRYHKFLEAEKLVAMGAGFVVKDSHSLLSTFSLLAEDTDLRRSIKNKLADWFERQQGGSEQILAAIADGKS